MEKRCLLVDPKRKWKQNIAQDPKNDIFEVIKERSEGKMERERGEIQGVQESEKGEIEQKFKKDTSSVLSTTLLSLSEGLTGIFSSKREEIFLSIGHIFQRMRGGKFLTQLTKEWKRYKEKGRIKEGYEDTEQHQECLQELLNYLENALPDEITFGFLKKIFLVAATESISSRETLLPQHYIRIIKKLSPGAILVLNSAYRISKEGFNPNERDARQWLIKIAEKSSLKWLELVENYEEELINYNLVTNRQLTDKSGVYLGNYYRLTDLGYNLCDYIEKYEE